MRVMTHTEAATIALVLVVFMLATGSYLILASKKPAAVHEAELERYLRIRDLCVKNGGKLIEKTNIKGQGQWYCQIDGHDLFIR